MNDLFYRQQAENYFERCHGEYVKQAENSPHISYSIISERKHGHPNLFTPMHIKVDLLFGGYLKEILDISFDSPHLFPNKNTYYLADISHHKETPYNSILFQLDEPPMKSTEKTNAIMNRYFNSKGTPYSIMQKIGKAFGYTSRVPYVLCETCFVPDGGTSKKTASWSAFHQMTHQIYDTKEKEIVLYSNNRPLLTLKINKSAFEKQFNRAAHLYDIQLRMAVEYFNNYSHFRMVRKEKNILDYHIERNTCLLPKYTFLELHHFITYFKASEILGMVHEADDPYLEDVKERFKFPDLPL